jgi:hypothetical protein
MTTLAAELLAPGLPSITAAFGSSKPDSTKGMLIVRDKLGHSTRHVDFADMEAWFTANHPSVFSTEDGARTFNIGAITPEMLDAYFAHNAAKDPSLTKLLQLGHLVGPNVNGYQYAQRGWAPGIAAGVVNVDGHVRIETIPVK